MFIRTLSMHNIHCIILFKKYDDVCIGCSDDVGTMYSVGEQFDSLDVTCSCGEGYSISCKQSLSSDESGS